MGESTRPARGMRDFLPSELRKREWVIGLIRSAYERFGFEPLETPAVENLGTLIDQYGDESSKLLFKIAKRGVHESSGESDLALRYDLTVPMARVVAEYRDKLPKPFKRFQIQPVWRADRPARGRFREFYQCDVDIVGTRSPIAEVELCAAVGFALQSLGFRDFRIRLNHRAILTGMLEACGVPVEQHNDALVALDKLDRIGPDGVQKEVGARTSAEAAGRLVQWLKELGVFAADKPANDAILARLESILPRPSLALEAAGELAEILRLSEATAANGHIDISVSLARGLSYYTGAVMEIYDPGLGVSIAGGGRYDNLVGRFAGVDVPACGFSLGLERIIVIMEEQGRFNELLPPGPTVMVAQLHADPVHALQLARELREWGLMTDLYPETAKLGRQFKYAEERQIQFVAIVGEDELSAGQVTLKDLTTGDQKRVSRAETGQAIYDAMAALCQPAPAPDHE